VQLRSQYDKEKANSRFKGEKSLPGPPPVLASTLRTSPRSPFPHYRIPLVLPTPQLCGGNTNRRGMEQNGNRSTAKV